jgi:leucine dehydrogenase
MSHATNAVLTRMTELGHELVVHAQDLDSGLKAIIAIHSSALGPALGGTRYYPYHSESDALRDVLRLSEGMSLKSAAAGLSLGGGKAVILGDPDTDKNDELLAAYGRAVDALAGRYVTAEDVGTTVEDMVKVRSATRWVTGLPEAMGGSGDPSPLTARGVMAAMRAVAAHLWNGDLSGRRVVVQGVGKVGADLARRLHAAGVDVIVSDIDEEAVASLRAEIDVPGIAPDEVWSTRCDILAPCALGAVLSAETIPTLRCAAVVGSANNQLSTDEDADRLADCGVLYLPDFVANAGGVINISHELAEDGYDREAAAESVDTIFDQSLRVLEEAAGLSITPQASAVRLARRRIAEAARLRHHPSSRPYNIRQGPATAGTNWRKRP